MKALKLIPVLITLTVGLACVADDQFDAPDTTTLEPQINGTIIDIDAVLGFLAQAQAAGDSEFTFAIDSDNYVSGYVVSNDEAGNFFETLILQDSPQLPTAGIKVLIDQSPLFTSFELGRKVYVKLAGLTVGISNGVAALGIGGGAFVAKISAAKIGDVLIRGTEVATITPMEVAMADFADEYENLFIRLTDVQFSRNQVLGQNPVTFAGEDSDEFDGTRFLESCAGGGVIVSTSTFASFKGLLLPKGRGYLDGILTRDFFDDFYTIRINQPSNIVFSNDVARCDPDVTNCTTPSGGGTSFFSENFDGYSSITQLEDARWSLVNTSGGEAQWEFGNFSGNQYMQITAFGSGENSIESWLITPAINMSEQTAEELTFKVQASFDNGTALTVLFATDFKGDPTLATWNLLDAVIPVGPGDGFGDFITVGPINVSCLEAVTHFAFLYTGSKTGPSTRYHIDNVVVKGL